jgi:polysaccharide biosynthesis protein PslG
VVLERRRPLALGAGLAGFAVLGGLVLGLRAGDQPTGRVGLSTHLLATDEPLRPQLEAMRRGGITWIREDFAWERLEPRPGAFVWDRTDALMASAAHEGVDVLAILDYSAPWASSDPSGDTRHPPRDPSRFAAYARAVVDRYGEGGSFWDGDAPERPLRAVEVWNEPWGFFFWKPEPDPARYAELARATAEAVRDAGRDVQVLVPADLLQVRSDGAIRPWFKELLEADPSLPELVDGWTVHPYPSPRDAPPDAGGDSRFAVTRIAEIHRLAVDAGVERPLWITELGWTTAPESDEGVTEEQQARYLGATLDLALGRWRDYVERTFVYTWSRSNGDPGDPEGHYGIRRPDGSLKPAWRAVTRRARSD